MQSLIFFELVIKQCSTKQLLYTSSLNICKIPGKEIKILGKEIKILGKEIKILGKVIKILGKEIKIPGKEIIFS